MTDTFSPAIIAVSISPGDIETMRAPPLPKFLASRLAMSSRQSTALSGDANYVPPTAGSSLYAPGTAEQNKSAQDAATPASEKL